METKTILVDALALAKCVQEFLPDTYDSDYQIYINEAGEIRNKPYQPNGSGWYYLHRLYHYWNDPDELYCKPEELAERLRKYSYLGAAEDDINSTIKGYKIRLMWKP